VIAAVRASAAFCATWASTTESSGFMFDTCKTLTDFLDQDPTGTRKMVYRMQELTRTANANGHNTIFLTDLGGPGAGVLPLPGGR